MSEREKETPNPEQPIVKRLPVSSREREEREEAAAYATEAYWKEKQGDEYGSY